MNKQIIQAREDVLKELHLWMQEYPDTNDESEIKFYIDLVEKINSLRSEVGK